MFGSAFEWMRVEAESRATARKLAGRAVRRLGGADDLPGFQDIVRGSVLPPSGDAAAAFGITPLITDGEASHVTGRFDAAVSSAE